MTAPAIVCLMGPTACGKTDLAVELVRRLPFEIISVDSALVYKGMDVGTAKPSADILQQAPHRLIDFLDPTEAYSAARFVTDVQREIADITAHGRIPLLVGGTMLYFRSLLEGIAIMPPAEPALRETMLVQANTQGWQSLHDELARADPAAAARIHPNDPQRILRALEVYRLTGTPISVWQAQTKTPLTTHILRLGLMPGDREILRQRIASRFELMLKSGLIDEVIQLRQRGDLTPDMPALRAVGYRQVWEYLEGQSSYENMVEKAITATRQLAKRQMTWLRGMDNVTIFDCLNNDLASEVLKTLQAVRIF